MNDVLNAPVYNHTQEEQIAVIQIVSVKLGHEVFGIDILRIQEINRLVSITRVPNAPNYVVGVINLRGKIVPVIDLRKKMNMPDSILTEQSRVVVVELNTKVVGFLVDQVDQVLEIPEAKIEPVPMIFKSTSSEYIVGVVQLDDAILAVLNINKILSSEELTSL